MSHLPAPAERARRCTRAGSATIAIALVLAVVTTGAALLVGGTLGAIALTTGLTGAGMATLAGLTLRNAPTQLQGTHLDAGRTRTVRRALVAFCVAAALCYLGFVVAALALGVTAVSVALLFLEALPTAFAVLAALTGHQLLRP